MLFGSADAWLRASQLENAVHVAGLSRKDVRHRCEPVLALFNEESLL